MAGFGRQKEEGTVKLKIVKDGEQFSSGFSNAREVWIWIHMFTNYLETGHSRLMDIL